jgi:hypothetical protein
MTNLENDDEQPDPVSSVIAAFVDGEAVESSVLKQALATPAGRDYLVDLLSMRGLMRSTFPSEATVLRPPSWFSQASTIVAAILLAALSGYLVGQRSGPLARRAQVDTSPVMIEFDQPATAPPPTRVIQLQRGLNWKDTTGGD